MNFGDIEHLWRSPHNRPTAAQLEQQRMEFLNELRRRHRQTRGLLIITFLPLAFFTGRIVAHALFPAQGLDEFDLAREWTVVPFFALPWVAWLVLLRHFLRGSRQRRDSSASIRDSVSALLADNQRRRTFHRIVAGVLLASALLLPLIVHQLRAVGKMGDEVTIPVFVIYPLYVGCILIWLVVHDRRKLQPRGRELASLLKAYIAEPT